METKKNKLIVVLGMHRSGTSAITRALQVLGVELGDRLMPSAEDNNKGFYEDIDLNELNIEMLNALGNDWYYLAPIKPNDVESLRKKGYFSHAVELLQQKVATAPVYGIKDPRVAKLLPFWQEVFSHCQLDVNYVMPIRHPLSVARSLDKRDDLEAEQSYLLWLGHVITGLIGSYGDKRVVVDYDRLMQSPDNELNRIAKCTGLKIDPLELQGYKTEFLDQGLRHTVYELNDLLLEDMCPPIVREVYADLLDVASEKIKLDDLEIQNKILSWSDEFKRLRSALLLVDKILSQKMVANQTVSDKDKQIGNLNQAVVEHDNQIKTLNQGIFERDDQIKTLNQGIFERDFQINILNQVIIERDSHINNLYLSSSWRFTSPFRWCKKQVLRTKLLIRAIPLAIRHTGSSTGTLFKILKIYRREGVAGIRSRLRFLLRHNGPSSFKSFKLPDPPSLATELTRGINIKDVKPHTESTDIIVCVHNALDDVKRCLYSVLSNTIPPYNLIIVDDGSGPDTKTFLEEFSIGQPCTLIRNEVASGYTCAANVGLRASKGDFIVLLNSDTIVSCRWLDRMIECINSDNCIGMVGPLSNTASWQSVPKIFDANGDWATNQLPPGLSVNEYANEVARVSPRIYPRVGFLNGFCLLISREVINDVGYFDDVIFARGYGEENDYCLRVTDKKWHLAVADDCYVFHAQSKSYSNKRRAELSRLAGDALAKKHGQDRIDQNLNITLSHPALRFMRKVCGNIEDKLILRDKALKQFEGKKVLFLLAAGTAGGGSNIVLLEAAYMRELGVDAIIANLENCRDLFEKHHPNISVPIIYLQSPTDLLDLASEFDAIIATLYLTVFWLKPLTNLAKRPVLGYYIQDFEPDFFPEGSADYKRALESYTVDPSIILFTKTQWNRKKLKKKFGLTPTIVGPSIDLDTHYPSPFSLPLGEKIRISAMVRPTTPRRAPEMTMRVLKRLADCYGDRLEITIFGLHVDDPKYPIPKKFPHRCLGELNANEVANVLSCTDIFLDCSEFQAMGLTAMEAMASGAAVVGPIHGGLSEIIMNGHNGLLVDTLNEDVIFAATCSLINETGLLTTIRKNALEVLSYSPLDSAYRILECLFPADKPGENVQFFQSGEL